MMTRDALSSYSSITRPTKIRSCTGITPSNGGFSFFEGFMSWRTIYISECERISLYLDSLLIIKDEEEYKIPLSDIGTIVIEDNKTVITVKLMNKILEYDILLVYCDDCYNPSGILFPLEGHFRQTKHVLNQIKWDEDVKKYLWKEIVQVKLENQAEILAKLSKDSKVIEKILKYSQEVELGDITNREGLGAKIYFRELFGNSFIRKKNNGDVINSGLNYGYTILNSKISRIISAKGMLTYLGIHHKGEYNHLNLSCDILEVYRPLVDYFVYKYMQNAKYFSKEDRIELINLLNARIQYNNCMETVVNSMEKYIDFIYRFFETGMLEDKKIPRLKRIEFYEL